LFNFVANKKDDEDVFDLINPTKLNEYLSSLMPGLTAKVFRTFNASNTLQQKLEEAVDNLKIRTKVVN
jgi:DNA topoisomerase-1